MQMTRNQVHASGKMNVTFTFEEACDSRLPFAVQEINIPCIEDNNEGEDEKEEAAMCKPISECSVRMHAVTSSVEFVT